MKQKVMPPILVLSKDASFFEQLTALADREEAKGHTVIVDDTHFRVFKRPIGQGKTTNEGRTNEDGGSP